jgi:hypothetical protein
MGGLIVVMAVCLPLLIFGFILAYQVKQEEKRAKTAK